MEYSNDHVCISVLIPVYNVPEKYLRRCIESCIHQTLNNIEIIIIDDGSTDDSGRICDWYADRDTRIHVIHNINEGLAKARNCALQNACGDYIIYVDGDDYIALNTCESLLSMAEKEEVQVLVFGYLRDVDGNIKEGLINDEKDKLYDQTECRNLLEDVFNYRKMISSVWGKLINRDFLLENEIFHENDLRSGAEGYIFTSRLFSKANKVLVTNQPFYFYTLNRQSISKCVTVQNAYMAIRCFKFCRENVLEKQDGNEKLLTIYYQRMLILAVWIIMSGIFNPVISLTFRERVREFQKLMKFDEIREAFIKGNYKELDFKRYIVILCMKYRMIVSLTLLGIMRHYIKKE